MVDGFGAFEAPSAFLAEPLDMGLQMKLRIFGNPVGLEHRLAEAVERTDTLNRAAHSGAASVGVPTTRQLDQPSPR